MISLTESPSPPDIAAEARAARSSAAIFETSSAAKLVLTGPDAPQLVHNVCTNDVANLPLGAGLEAFFSDARAKALFRAQIYHVMLNGEHAFWLETAPGRGPALAAHLDRFLISEQVEIADVTADYAQFHLAGPNAKVLLDAALGEELPSLAEFAHVERTFGSDGTCNIRARSLLGITGYDIVCLKARGVGVWRMLTAAGVVPASAEAFEVLRIEAGTPSWGQDYDEKRFVMEVGHAARAVSYTKGCFPGQEPIVMSRDRAGRVNRHFIKLRSESTIAPGMKLMRDGVEVGIVTSAAMSDELGSVALGYVRWDASTAGTEYDAEGVKVVSAGSA